MNYSKIITKCLKDFLPPNAKEVSVHGVHKLTEHGTTAVPISFFLTYVSDGLKQEKEFFLKIYKKEYEESGHAEFSVLKTLKEHNLPVPTPYFFETDNRIMGNSFLITEKIVGKTAQHYLNDKMNSLITVDKMAKILVEIHKLDPLTENFKFLRRRFERDQLSSLETLIFIKKRCMNFLGFFPLSQRRFIGAVKRLEEEKQEKFQAAILHRSYEPSHVIVSNRGFFVVDWGDAVIGDPAYDVAMTYHMLRLGRENFELNLGERFVKSYEQYRGQKLVNLQLMKDISALNLAVQFGLSPFYNNKFLNYGALMDLNFGYVLGKLREIRKLNRLKKLYCNHHTAIHTDFEYMQNYALQYLESAGR